MTTSSRLPRWSRNTTVLTATLGARPAPCRSRYRDRRRVMRANSPVAAVDDEADRDVCSLNVPRCVPGRVGGGRMWSIGAVRVRVRDDLRGEVEDIAYERFGDHRSVGPWRPNRCLLTRAAGRADRSPHPGHAVWGRATLSSSASPHGGTPCIDLAACVSPSTRVGLALVGTSSSAAVAAPDVFPDEIDLPNGWAPEGITGGNGTTLFVGSLEGGAIWRADARTGTGAVLVPGVAGQVAVGVEHDADAGRLWVAGGPTGASARLRRATPARS